MCTSAIYQLDNFLSKGNTGRLSPAAGPLAARAGAVSTYNLAALLFKFQEGYFRTCINSFFFSFVPTRDRTQAFVLVS